MIESIFGAQLKVGDTIKVWWTPGKDTIIKLTSYNGVYKNLPGWEGVKIAEFVIFKTGMTIFPGEMQERIIVKE